MFKKLMAFMAWALLLCILFIICFVISVATELSLLSAVAMWLVLIITVLAVRFIWGSISCIRQAKYIQLIRARFQLSRMENVIFAHWKTGAAVIKQVARRKKSLPWFVLTGGRSGKTTLMAGAGLPLFSNEPENSLVVPTRTLRWWFFRTAGFLDLSSYFLSKTPAFERGWLRLVNWCGRIPAPVGIVVCLPVSELLHNDTADLHLRARHIRTQIEPLIKKTKRRLPVYLFITCCDHIPGFTLWANKLSPQQRQQAFGYYWLNAPIVDGQDSAVLTPLFNSLKEGVDKARVSMLNGEKPDADMLAVLDFPEQLQALQPALQRYLAALCEPDVYFEPATPGGIWFTATEPVNKNSATRQAFFVHDLITDLLPALSRQHKAIPIGYCRRYLQQWRNFTLSAVVIIYLLSSAYFTSDLISGDVKKMSVAAQVQQHVNIESWSKQPLYYLPFVPLIHQREKLLEASILSSTPRAKVSIENVQSQYLQQFSQADQPGKRTLILALAETIMTEQAMVENQPIAEIIKRPPIPAQLSMAGASTPQSRLQDAVVQRVLLQQPYGARQLHALRQLLGELVNSDPQLNWLVAPSDVFASVNLTDFLPWSASKAHISGMWTQPGTVQIANWLAQIRKACAGQPTLTALDSFEQHWSALRQTQWISLLLAFTQQPEPTLPNDRWQEILIAVDQGNSPAMSFARYVNEQLADIRQADALPWLRDLRRINQLQQAPVLNSMMQRANQLEQSARQKIAAMLKLDNKAKPVLSGTNIKLWGDWKNSLHTAVSDGVGAAQNSDWLTRGLFQASASDNNNPLKLLNNRFAALRANMSTPGNDFAVNAVWSLYQDDVRLLISHAMQRSGCWFQKQWQSRVLWPMEKNASRLEYQAQQDLAMQYLADFVRGPAKSVLVVGESGPAAGTFDGQTVNLTPQFLRIVNHVLRPDDVLVMPERENTRNDDALAVLQEKQTQLEAQIAQLESKPLDLALNSQPATVPGSARLMPTGSEIVMFCDDKRWALTSMNFSDRTLFRWRPGHCGRVTLTVNFPGFNLQYDYFGEGAWPDFLRDFTQGRHRYDAGDFPEQAAQLATLGIKEVMVRYQIEAQTQTQETWQQWQELHQALEDNASAQKEIGNRKAEQQRPTVLKGALSQLPAQIASCV